MWFYSTIYFTSQPHQLQLHVYQVIVIVKYNCNIYIAIGIIIPFRVRTEKNHLHEIVIPFHDPRVCSRNIYSICFIYERKILIFSIHSLVNSGVHKE